MTIAVPTQTPLFFLWKQFWNKCEIILVINRIQAMKVIHIHLIFPPIPPISLKLVPFEGGVGPDPRILWFGNHCDYNFVIKHCQMRKLIHIHPSPSALAAPPSLTLTSVCSPTNLIESYFLFSILQIFSSSHFSVFIFKSFICSHLLLSTFRYPTKNFLLSSVAGNGHHPTIINIFLTYFKFHISLSWYSGQVLSFFQRLISFCPRWQGVGAIQHESAIVGDGVGSSALGPASNTRKYKERNMVHKHLEMQNTESEKYDILLGAGMNDLEWEAFFEVSKYLLELDFLDWIGVGS